VAVGQQYFCYTCLETKTIPLFFIPPSFHPSLINLETQYSNQLLKNELKLLSIDYPILDDGITNWVRFGQFLKEEFLKGKVKG
jgi:hypothetical protein